MIKVRHPYIDPPLVIEVEAERLPEFTGAGWLPDEEPTSDPDPDAPGDEGPDSPKENA